jgi:hypothetical protein
MDNLFLALLLVSIVACLVGVVRPHLVGMSSRKWAAMTFAGAAVVFFVLFGFTSQKPLTPTTTAAIQSPSPATTSPEAFGATQATSSKVGGQCASAAAIAFADVETDYAKAYQDGKNALGSTQYADANAGLRALTIAGSAASKFSGWQKTWRAYEPNFYNLIVQGYNTASNCYSEVGVTEPASLASWRDGLAQLDADISAWVADATGWQIRETSGTKFSDDEAKVDTDFGMVQRDIDDVKSGR